MPSGYDIDSSALLPCAGWSAGEASRATRVAISAQKLHPAGWQPLVIGEMADGNASGPILSRRRGAPEFFARGGEVQGFPALPVTRHPRPGEGVRRPAVSPRG